jgi:hypothetical protein
MADELIVKTHALVREEILLSLYNDGRVVGIRQGGNAKEDRSCDLHEELALGLASHI